jgi:hypothetical protein
MCIQAVNRVIESTENQTLHRWVGEIGVGNTYVMEDDADLGYFFTCNTGYWTLDMQPQYIETEDPDITIVDASSDMFKLTFQIQKEI